MMRGRASEALCVLLLVGLIGCDRQPAPEAAAPTEPSAPSPMPAAPDAAAAAPPPRPAGPAGLLGRPSAPVMPARGESSTQPEGCLARAPAARAEPAQTRSAPQLERAPSAPVTLTSRADGVRIVSAFEHNCCHSARTEVEVSDARVRVVHQLSGESCRCMCSSALTTQVGLAPGRYALEVEVMAEGGASILSERQEVEVAAAP